MKLFPSLRLVSIAALLASAGVFLLFAPVAMPIFLLAVLALGASVGYDVLWLRKNGHGIRPSLQAPGSVTLGDAMEATLTIENTTPRAVAVTARPMLPVQSEPQLRVVSAGVPSGARSTFALRIQSRIRGDHAYGDIYARFAGPLGLFCAQVQHQQREVCKVYPDVATVKDYIVTRRLRNLAAPHLRTARLRGIGSDFESLRDYEDGDDIRRIDWKATARQSRLITRNYEIEHFRDVMIVLDRGRLMAGRVGDGTKFDKAVDAGLMLAAVALDSGDRCGMMVFDDDVVSYRAPRAGMPQLQALIDSVYDIQPTLGESHFRRAFMHLQTRLTKRSMVIVLSDVVDIDASAALVQGILSLARRHLVLFAALRTPEIEQVIARQSNDPESPYRKAVAYRLVHERTDVIARISHGGVHALDIAPDELTMPVVNKYVELREQNLL